MTDLQAVEKQNRWPLIAATLFVVALVVRLLWIGRESFWYDEIVAANIAQQSWQAIFSGHARDGGNPQGFWLLAKLWAALVGWSSESSLRIISALIGAVTPAVVFWFGRKMLGITTAFVAALLLAFSPNHIYMSQEYRPYTLAFLACVGVLHFSMQYWVHGPRRPAALGYVICCLIGLYSFYYTALIMLGVLIWAALNSWQSKQFRSWIALNAAVVLFYVPGLLLFVEQFAHRSRSVTTEINTAWLHLGATPLTVLFGRSLVWKEDGAALFALAVVLSLCMLLFLGWIWWRKYQGKEKALLLCAIVVPLFVVGAMIAVKNMHAWDDRKALFVLMPILLIIGQACNVMPRIQRYVTMGTLLGLCVIANVHYFTQENRDDWRSAAQQLLSTVRDGDAVGVAHADELESLAFYLRRAPTQQATRRIELFGFNPDNSQFENVRALTDIALEDDGAMRDTFEPTRSAQTQRVWVVSLVRRGDDAILSPEFQKLIGGKTMAYSSPLGHRLVLRRFDAVEIAR
jgi:mannosyltransferase